MHRSKLVYTPIHIPTVTHRDNIQVFTLYPIGTPSIPSTSPDLPCLYLAALEAPQELTGL